MNYAVDLATDDMMHIPSFIKLGSGIQKLIGGVHKHTGRQHGDTISLLLFTTGQLIRKNPLSLNICLKYSIFMWVITKFVCDKQYLIIVINSHSFLKE
jgi:hypothetical protein